MNTLHAYFADRFPPGKGLLLAELDHALCEPFEAVARRESDETVAKMRAIGIEVVDA